MANTSFSAPFNSTFPAAFAGFDASKMQQVASNLFEATKDAQAIITENLAQHAGKIMAPGQADPFGALDTHLKLGAVFARNPEKAGHAMASYVQSWMELMQSMANPAAMPKDRRFSDPEWTSNPVFSFMRRAYMLNAEWMRGLVETAGDELDDETRMKAKFFTEFWIDAMSPTNSLASNPAAMRALVESGGKSIAKGMRNLREDLRRGDGRLAISQTDESGFTLGENIATSNGVVVFRNELIEIIHYSPTKAKAHERPLLIFPPWINKFYILDLQPQNSMIRWLLEQGVQTFVVSWRSADQTTKDFDWDDYVEKGILAAVDAVTKACNSPDINAVGYCIAGTLLTTTLAHMSKTGDTRINSATYFASQSDFELAGELKIFATGNAADYIDSVIDENDGIMPGELMSDTFNWLRPSDLVWRYVVDNYMMGKAPKPFDLLYWNADQTNIPGKTHRTYLRKFYNENALSRGAFEVFGEPVSMSDITIPVFIHAGRADHICPWQSIYKGAHNYGGDTTFMLAGSGHIAGVINPPNAKKYQHWVNSDLPAAPGTWLAASEEIEGSWWPSWWSWLEPKSGAKVDSVQPADQGLGRAPGQYAMMHLNDIKVGAVPAGPMSDDDKPESSAPEAKPETAEPKSDKPKKKKAKAAAGGKKKKKAANSKAKSSQGNSGKAQKKKRASPAARVKAITEKMDLETES